jgi:hypothetical protein
MDVIHRLPTVPLPRHHRRYTTRVLCAVHQSQTRVPSGHRESQIAVGHVMLQVGGAGNHYFVLVLQTADIYPRLHCADSCNIGRKYIAVVCGDIEVLRVKGLVCRRFKLTQGVKMFREGPLGYLALATSPRTVVSWRQHSFGPIVTVHRAKRECW